MYRKYRNCAYCLLPCAPTRDHARPQHLGGKLHDHRGQNWVPACVQCNAIKGGLPWSWWIRALPVRPEVSLGPSLESFEKWLLDHLTPGFKWMLQDVQAELTRRKIREQDILIGL